MVTNDWHQEEDQVVRKPIVSKTAVWKAVALSAGMGLAMLSYPVHAAKTRMLSKRSTGFSDH